MLTLSTRTEILGHVFGAVPMPTRNAVAVRLFTGGTAEYANIEANIRTAEYPTSLYTPGVIPLMWQTTPSTAFPNDGYIYPFTGIYNSYANQYYPIEFAISRPAIGQPNITVTTAVLYGPFGMSTLPLAFIPIKPKVITALTGAANEAIYNRLVVQVPPGRLKFKLK